MFCPKCGSENPEAGKFCRKCGSDLVAVSLAIGNGVHTGSDLMGSGDGSDTAAGDNSRGAGGSALGCDSLKDPDDLFAAGIRSSVLGLGFLIISAVLFFTNVAGGHAWWWAMLFPGFGMLASGIGNVSRAKRKEKRLRRAGYSGSLGRAHSPPQEIGTGNTDFVPSKASSRFETGDLVPPSVVENTTRLLKKDSESETMTLPDLERKER